MTNQLRGQYDLLAAVDFETLVCRNAGERDDTKLHFRSAPEEGAKSYDLAEALLALSLSLVLFFRRDLFDAALPMLWGALLVVGGFLLLQTAVDFLRMKVSIWWPQLVGAIVALALGALALVRPSFLSDRMPVYIGVSLIVVAAFNLMNLILLALHSRGKLKPKAKSSPAKPTADSAPTTPAAAAPSAAPFVRSVRYIRPAPARDGSRSPAVP